jgi:hypothetical protein
VQIWGTTLSPFSVQATPLASVPATRPVSIHNFPMEDSMKKLPLAGVEEVESSEGDLESLKRSPESLARPVLFTSAVFVGCGLCLVIVLLCGFATSKLLVESLIDGKWLRMALCATIPLLIMVALFFVSSAHTPQSSLEPRILTSADNYHFYRHQSSHRSYRRTSVEFPKFLCDQARPQAGICRRFRASPHNYPDASLQRRPRGCYHSNRKEFKSGYLPLRVSRRHCINLHQR